MRGLARRLAVASRQRLLEHVPGQHGALHPDRVLHHSLESDQLAEFVLVGLSGAGHHPPEVADQPLRLLDRLAVHRLGHHRGRALGDRASLPKERDPGYLAVLLVDEDRDLVAAEWVVPGAGELRPRELALVPGVLVVVEDGFLVDLVQRHATSLRPGWRPAYGSNARSRTPLPPWPGRPPARPPRRSCCR